MPSIVVNAHTTAVSVFSVPTHQVGIIKAIMTDHRDCSVDHKYYLQDNFTYATSTVRSTGVATTGASLTGQNRLIWSVGAGAVGSIGEDQLKALRFLGDVELDADAIDADADITIQWELYP